MTLTRGLCAWQFGATSVSLNPAYLPQFPYVGNGQPSGELTRYPAFSLGGNLVGISCKIAVVGVSQATSEVYVNGMPTGLTCVLVAGAFRGETWAAAPIVIPALATNYIEVRVSHTGALVALQYFNVTVYGEATASPVP